MKRTRLDEPPPTDPPYAPDVGIWNRPGRPKIVGLIGWLMAAVGYASFVLKGGTLPTYFMDMRWLNPDWRPMPLSRGQFAVTVSFVLAEMAVGLLAIAGGLGVLKMRAWGRRTAVWYALVAAALTLLKAAWAAWMFDFMLDYQASTTTQPFDRTSAGNAQFFALIVSAVAQLLPCAIVASILTRPWVRDAFDRAEAARQ